MARKRTEPGAPSSRFPDGFRILKGKQEYVTYVDRSSIRIWVSEVAAHYDNHMHSAVEIIMPHRGVSTYHLQDMTYSVHPGEILIIPSGCPHALTEPEDTYRHLFLFEPNPIVTLRDMASIAPMMQKTIYLQRDTEVRRQVSQILMDVADCYEKREPLWNTQCYAQLMQIYVLLGRQYLQSVSPGAYAERYGMDSPILSSAIIYIDEHYMNDISLEQVADFVGFSKYYFSRTFKSFMGMSFSDYLTRKRLSVAVDLLVRTGQSIQSVAKASGFGSSATFNRVFRDQKNCTPTQFRYMYNTMLLTDTPARDL